MPVPESRRILSPADASSEVFKVEPGGQYQLVVSGHSGGEWVLQVRTADGEPWISTGTDGTFSSDGIKSMYLNQDVEYRLEGGSKGADAFLIPVYGGRGAVSV